MDTPSITTEATAPAGGKTCPGMADLDKEFHCARCGRLEDRLFESAGVKIVRGMCRMVRGLCPGCLRVLQQSGYLE